MISHSAPAFFFKYCSVFVLTALVALGIGSSLAGAGVPPKLGGACAFPSDACWEAGFHQPGVTGTVYAMIRDNSGNIYVGGEIIAAGGIPVNNLAMWDGTIWRDVGGGITIAAGTARVSALAVDANNNLIVGGSFDQAGGAAADHIARWDGFAWSALSSGTDSNVFALAPVGNRVMVGGVFKKAGGIPSSYLGAYTFPPPAWAPAPTLTSLSPGSIPAGGAGFWLTVDGANFSSRSVVRWNANPLPTT